MVMRVPLGNRIVAAATPRVAAGEAAQRQQGAAQRAMPAHRFGGVFRAGREIAAGRRQDR